MIVNPTTEVADQVINIVTEEISNDNNSKIQFLVPQMDMIFANIIQGNVYNPSGNTKTVTKLIAARIIVTQNRPLNKVKLSPLFTQSSVNIQRPIIEPLFTSTLQ